MTDLASQSGSRVLGPAVREMIDAAVLVDADGVIREVSSAFEIALGWANEELIGQPLRHFLTAEPYGEGAVRQRTALPSAEGADASTPAHRYRHRDGSTICSDVVSVPLHLGNGASGGFIHILHGVSSRRQQAESLMALIGFVAMQKAGDDVDLQRFLDFGCRCFGLDAGIFFRRADDGWYIEAMSGDVDGRPGDIAGAFEPSALLSPDDEITMIGHAGGGGSSFQALRHNTGFEAFLISAVEGIDRRFGTLCFIGRKSRDCPFDDQERDVLRFLAHWLATRLDADEAKHSHEDVMKRLGESEERHRILYEKSPAMLHSIDDRGRLTSVSDAWLATLGYTREEVIGRPSTDFLTSESRRFAKEVVLPAYRAAGSCKDIAYQFVTKNGDVRDILLSAISQTDEDGRFSRSLAILLDVTERLQVDRRLARKTKALERSNADLARFAQIASHDFQEPLRRIITYCDLLKEDYGAELSDGAMAITSVIQSGGRRLRLMINDLLTYVDISEQLDRDAEPVDLTAVVCFVQDDLHEVVLARQARIDVAHLPLVWGRAPMLRTLFHHLLSNAIIHGGDRSLAIKISIEDAGNFWQFAVTDNGIGVEPRFGDKIFEIFQRLHVRDESESSGAGLAICRLIIQRCGGDIWLDRTYRDGARFLFTLPKNKPEDLEPAVTVSPPLPDRVDQLHS